MAQLGSTTVFGELSVTAKSLLQGNVGIGTTSPAYALDVSGDVRATGTFRGSLTVDALSGYGIRPSIELQGVHANDTTNENSGAAIFFRTSTSEGYGPMISGIRRSGGAGALVFLTNTTAVDSQTERMRIAENGNVGIGTTAPAYKLDVSGDVRATGTFRGSLTGNASTATTLATARTINGTSFNGSANITTANWGTARTLTIGSTGKSVNGSGNVSWTLAEIGAAPASHTHSYLPLSGGSLVGDLNLSNYNISGVNNYYLQMPTTTGGWARGIYYRDPGGDAVASMYFYGSGSNMSRFGINQGGYNSSDGIHIVASTGNVGIGTTSPSYPLHVIGNVGFSGTLQAGTVPWARISGAPATATSHPTWAQVTGKPSTFTPSSHSHGAGDLPSATTSAKGIVQLSTSTSSTSTTLAATASAVKAAYDVGNHSHPYAPSSHTHTASQVGLGNVQNYGIATQAQAQAGTANNVYMTPLRVKNAISAITKTEIESKLGLNDLLTTHKSTVVGAINELFTDVGNGKTLIAGAITDKGVPTNPSDTFSAMAENIGEIGKPIEKNGDLLFIKESPDLGGAIYAITSDDNYVYAGGGGSLGNQTVKKLNKSDLSVVATSPDYGGAIRAITSDDNYVYVGGTGFDQRVRKLNKSNLSLVATSTFGYSEDILALTSDDNYIYVGGTGQRVRKLNKSDLSLVATGPDSGGTINALTTDDNYIYVGGTAAQKIQKLNKSDLSVVATNPGYGGVVNAITSDDNYVYAGGASTQAVRRFNKSNLQLVATSPSYGGTIYALTIDNNYIYVGGQTSQTVMKIDMLTTILPLVTTSPSYGGIIYALTIDDNYIYAGGATAQRVKKLNKSVYELDGIDYVRI